MALMGSGFVLAVPVFFDTVFYLLVPLARSLYRKTNRHYVKYIIAIAAGGAITHTLVPPTPGPLLMAANLNIDIGAMIIVGALVAIPAAIAGLMFASFMDRKLDIPMRSQNLVDEPEPLSDDKLPSLFMSLLPVLLPVFMISVNTVLSTIADGESAARLKVADIKNWQQVQQSFLHSGDDDKQKTNHYLATQFKAINPQLAQLPAKTTLTSTQQQEFITGLNKVLANRKLYSPEQFEHILSPKWKVDQLLKENKTEQLTRMKTIHSLLQQDRVRMKVVNIERMNRLLLETAFPDAITPHTWNTPAREAANVGSLFGNANLALLLSTAIAMFVLWKQRKPTLKQLGMTVETSLMSGGAIILITAAGGAFGGMLAVANVGTAILDIFGEAESTGIFFLFLGFGMASLMKVAQGSGTTAMIVVSGMLAPSVAEVELGYHTVYIATSIGAGSLFGSWMNDSGFWIFAKMSGLTEVEALKTWTPLLMILGIVSLATTLLLAIVLPNPLIWLS